MSDSISKPDSELAQLTSFTQNHSRTSLNPSTSIKNEDNTIILFPSPFAFIKNTISTIVGATVMITPASHLINKMNNLGEITSMPFIMIAIISAVGFLVMTLSALALIRLLNRDKYITFNFSTETYYYGISPKTDRSYPIAEIGAIQVLSEYVISYKKHTDSDGHTTTVKDNHIKYETNLVLRDGSRLTLIDTRELARAMDIAHALSKKLNVELWDYSTT